MKRVLIVQPQKVLTNDKIDLLNNYVRDSFEEGVLVLNKDISYEIVEIDVKDKVEENVVEKCDGEVVGADENH